MNTPHLLPPVKTDSGLLLLVVGVALLSSVDAARAGDLLVTTFDSDLSGIAWENWRSYVLGHNEVWDPTQDAEGDSNSGSMYITLNWPLTSDSSWNNNWNDVQVAFMADTFDSADYLEVEAHIKIDVTNSFTALDGSYGVAGLYVQGQGGWQQVQGYSVLAATDGWQRVHGSLEAIPDDTYSTVIVGFISNGDNSLTNTVHYWLDNVIITEATSVPTNGPTLNLATPPPPGLTCIASAPGNAWQRQMVRTVNSNYTWHTSSSVSDTSTYAITVADFPGSEHSGFEAMMYLIPLTGIHNPDGGSVDWDSEHVAYFTISANEDGTGRGSFRYKVNSPGAEVFQAWTDFDCASGPLGTWALTVYNNTNVTITAPDNTSTTFTIPTVDADLFQGELIAYFGVRPTSTTRIGQSATFSRIKITGPAGAVDDTFVSSEPPYLLDPATWVRKAPDPQGVIITSPDAKYWLSWYPPDDVFQLQSGVDLAGAGDWAPVVPAPGGFTVGFDAGPVHTVVIDQSELSAEGQDYWRLYWSPPPMYFVDDFEDGVEDWTWDAGAVPTAWELGTPHWEYVDGAITTTASGTNAWGTALTSGYGTGVDITLTSPAFDLLPAQPGVGATVQWQATQDISSLVGEADYATLSVIAGGVTSEVFRTTSGSQDNWKTFEAPLDPGLMGQTIQLEYRFVSPAGDGWWGGYFIDDVVVVQTEP